MSLTVEGSVSIKSNYTETITIGLGSAQIPEGINHTETYTNGTGANAINEIWSKTSTPAISTPDTWTLSALTQALSGSGSRTIAFTKVRMIIIENNGTGVLLLTAGATHPVGWLPGSTETAVPIEPGGTYVMTAPGSAGLTVTSSSADTIQIDPGATAGNYKILIVGE
jgi:hypothetical protein